MQKAGLETDSHQQLVNDCTVEIPAIRSSPMCSAIGSWVLMGVESAREERTVDWDDIVVICVALEMG